MNTAPHIVIIGTGHGGVQAAASLRENGYEGAVTLIGDEPELPYHRPPLSKSYVISDCTELDPLRSAEFFGCNDIDMITGQRATRIDPRGRRVHLDSGSSLTYDHLVLALGSRNRCIPIEGADLDGVLGLRTAADARTIRDRLASVTDIVVVGGGFIGMEFAAAAAAIGKNVTVIEAGPRTMARAVSPAISSFLESAAHESGVRLVTAGSVARFDGAHGSVRAVIGAAGERYPAELVLVGIGAQANSELAEEAGLAVGARSTDGIIVDRRLLTSNPDISAIGDCARFPVGQSTMRLESVQNAVDQARSLSLRLTGQPADYHKVPWFWSNQGKTKLQITGLGADIDRVVTRGDIASGKFSLFGYCGQTLLTVESINKPGDHMAARRILEAGVNLTPEQACDVNFKLKDACTQSAEAQVA